MRELLTKDEGLYRPSVIKKAAAIFLLITLVVIGSIPGTAFAEHRQLPGMIAANPTTLFSEFHVENKEIQKSILGEIPRQVYQTPFNVPTLETDPLASIIRKPELVLGGADLPHASSRIPSFTGIITSTFGWRKHPIKRKARHHNGIDLAAKLGEPVLAPAAGRIIFSGVRNGYGNVVEIDHENGYTSLLAHNSKLLVRTGDIVNAGMVIAKAGSTGLSTGVHIHLEIRKDGQLLNPLGFMVTTHLASNHQD